MPFLSFNGIHIHNVILLFLSQVPYLKKYIKNQSVGNEAKRTQERDGWNLNSQT